jgi:hypothetical protein
LQGNLEDSAGSGGNTGPDISGLLGDGASDRRTLHLSLIVDNDTGVVCRGRTCERWVAGKHKSSPLLQQRALEHNHEEMERNHEEMERNHEEMERDHEEMERNNEEMERNHEEKERDHEEMERNHEEKCSKENMRITRTKNKKQKLKTNNFSHPRSR